MRFMIAVATACARAYYAALKLLVRPRRKVVLLSRQSEQPSADLLAVAAALRTEDPGVEVVVRARFIGTSVGSRVAALFAMLGQMYHLAGARGCVVDGYVVPVSLLDHRPGLFVVQMWHALGAVKKFGYQSVGKPGGHSAWLAGAMRMHHNYDLVCCGGPASVEPFAEAFGVPTQRVEVLGLPRTDLLRESMEQVAADARSAGVVGLLERFPELGDPTAKVLLYAPTFRTSGDAPPYRAVAERLASEGWTVAVRPHPLETPDLAGTPALIANDVDLIDLLPWVDMVLTDYSAIAFEAAAVAIPVGFYLYDRERYVAEVGLNLDALEQFPSITTADIEALPGMVSRISAADEAQVRLREGYASAPGGVASRLAARIIASTRTD